MLFDRLMAKWSSPRLLLQMAKYRWLDHHDLVRALDSLPCGSLSHHDRSGGQTVSRHIGKDTRYLKDRVNSGRARIASSFWNAHGARGAVAYAINTKFSDIVSWLSDPLRPNRLVLDVTFPIRSSVGYGFAQHLGLHCNYRQIKVVLERVSSVDFFIVTAFPR